MLGIRTLHLAALPVVLLACALAQPAVAPSPRGTVPLEANCCGRSQSSQVLSFAEGGDNYRSVHVDTIAPDKMAQFAGARREWIVEMKRAHGNDGRGLFMQVGKNRFYTIRSFARFGDFDTRGAVIEKSLAALPKEAGSRYDRLCDTALVFPHSSEIWSVDGDLGYAPAEGAITEQMAASGLMIIEDVRPDPRSLGERGGRDEQGARRGALSPHTDHVPERLRERPPRHALAGALERGAGEGGAAHGGHCARAVTRRPPSCRVTAKRRSSTARPRRWSSATTSQACDRSLFRSTHVEHAAGRDDRWELCAEADISWLRVLAIEAIEGIGRRQKTSRRCCLSYCVSASSATRSLALRASDWPDRYGETTPKASQQSFE